MIAALILGRKGSQGFPGKNTVPVLGRPLCWYPMMAALKTKSIDSVYLSTDDETLMTIAAAMGIHIIVRPPELCTAEALGEDAYVHGYEFIKENAYGVGRTAIEMMVLMMCNAATIIPRTIEGGISVLRANPGIDSAVTVSRYNMWSPLRARKIEKVGSAVGLVALLKPFVPFETFGDPATLNCDRDSQGDVWFADMGVSVVRPWCLENIEAGLLPQKWMGQNIYPLRQEGGCDVDYEWQLPGVEYWLRGQGFTEERTPYE